MLDFFLFLLMPFLALKGLLGFFASTSMAAFHNMLASAGSIWGHRGERRGWDIQFSSAPACSSFSGALSPSIPKQC